MEILRKLSSFRRIIPPSEIAEQFLKTDFWRKIKFPVNRLKTDPESKNSDSKVVLYMYRADPCVE